MPLLTFDSLDVVPEELREFAKQNDGSDKFVVSVVPAKRLDEFRDNNINISKERDELVKLLEPLKRIVGDDPDAFDKTLTELRQTSQRVKDGELKEGRAIEEAVGKRTDEMRKSFEDRLQQEGKEKLALLERHRSLDLKYRQGLVASAVKDACVLEDSGVEPKAIGDVIKSAYDLFQVNDDGKIVPMSGDVPIYGTDGVSPMTPREWLVKLREEKPYLFKISVGGGAGGVQPGKMVHGRTHDQLKSMSASERLAAANGEKVASL